jgi:hypothetical protein
MAFKRILAGYLFLHQAVFCFSQTDSLNSRDFNSSGISLAFNSSLIYPGVRIGIELPVYTVVRIKSHDEKAVNKLIKDRFASFNAGWYHHPDFHDNIYFTAEWRMRRTNKGGFFTEFSPGLGYSRTFLGATTYVVDNNGEVTIDKLAGYNYALLTFGGGLGYNFSEKKRLPLSLFCRFNILTMFPYNSTFYIRPVMELGLIYKPVHFMPVLVKKRSIWK